ncbi:hypothetical protein WR25_03584 [Diploscapter pachys]|uniref:Uncharacterized protein n=1 Tax=Diploscapter pachys TaxID=2018661 RepID=A0A2A2LGV7_9BILA|nr:hypothetical protein WR25_03584 [Diploscapter pachys]
MVEIDAPQVNHKLLAEFSKSLAKLTEVFVNWRLWKEMCSVAVCVMSMANVMSIPKSLISSTRRFSAASDSRREGRKRSS